MSVVVHTLLYPLHAAVLASLHAVLASSRCVRLLLRLAQLSPLALQIRRRRRLPTVQQDLQRARWSKLPRHLAVALVPGRQGRWPPFAASSSATTDAALLEDKVDGVRRLLEWSTQLRVGTLSIYDETGLLVRHAAAVADQLDLNLCGTQDVDVEGMVTLQPRILAHVGALVKELDVAPPPGLPSAVRLPDLAQDEVGSASSSTLVETPSPARPLSPITTGDPPGTVVSLPPPTLQLLSRAAGRPRLARLAAQLAATEGKRETPWTAEQVACAIDSLPLGEPDLLLVLGGSYLRLWGFPPWQLRLTELHHYSHPTWLPALQVQYEHLRGALDTYGRAEMRLGR